MHGLWIDPAVKRSESALAAGVAFGSVAIFAAAFLAWTLGALTPGVGVAALVLAGLAGWLTARSSARRAGASLSWTRWEWLAFGILALVSLRQFLWLVFERDGVLLTLLPQNYGDLPLHWSYIQHLASGAAFWPENPILTHERLRYPFGVDLLAAVFVQLGAPLAWVLKAMGLAGALLTGLALRRWGGAFAVAGFLFAGGLAGLPVLFSFPPVDADSTVAWKNLFLALFVPQRGFLLALPAGLLLLDTWRARLLRGEPGLLADGVVGLVWGALPLVHLHTFAFVSVLGAVWAIASGRTRVALPGLAMALLPASWAVWQVTDGFRAAALVGWAPGWVIGDENAVAFLLRNFGLWIPLALAVLLAAARARRHHDLLLLVPALSIFGLLFVIRAAPWAWDNTKLMLWCHLAALPVFGRTLAAWTGGGRRGALLRAATLALLFASGAQALLWACASRLPRLEIVAEAEYAAVCDALGRIETRRVATAQTFNHPVALCGRKIVAGYAGHLWSHGLDSAATEASLKRLMQGEPGWREDARTLGASHLFWGAREAAAFPGSAQPWRGAELAASGPWGAIYRLQ